MNDRKEIDDFFIMTTHELRTSLSAMKWLFKMLVDGDFGSLTPEQHNLLLRANDTNERMISLVADVMSVLKNDVGEVRYVFAPCNLGKLINESIKDFSSAAEMKHMHLSFNEPVEPVLVSADESRLRIVIDNLIENAIKYGSRETGISIHLASDNTNASLTIEDQGIGIPEAEQEHLFGKFFRASNTTQHPGTGLGLYVTKKIIEHHHGTITVQSIEGVSTTFTVTIPVIAGLSQ
jgi:two-component system, OmpR family, phosphate regulon sensor histidine kinase PhoR